MLVGGSTRCDEETTGVAGPGKLEGMFGSEMNKGGRGRGDDTAGVAAISDEGTDWDTGQS